MAVIFHMIFSTDFSYMKVNVFRFKFHWYLFARIQLTLLQHLFRYWLTPIRGQGIILTSDGLVYRYRYESLGLSELFNTGDRPNINMPSHRYRDSHLKDKTVSRSSYLYNENLHNRKTVFILRGAQVLSHQSPGNSIYIFHKHVCRIYIYIYIHIYT